MTARKEQSTDEYLKAKDLVVKVSFEKDTFGIPTIAVVLSGDIRPIEYSVVVFFISTFISPFTDGTTILMEVKNASFGIT